MKTSATTILRAGLGRARLAVALCVGGLLSLTAPAQVTTTASSTAAAASLVASARPATLLTVTGYNAKGSAQFIQILDATSVPSDAVTGVAEISTVVTTGLNVTGVAEISTMDTTGLTAAGLANEYFTLHGASDAAFYVWFNLDAGGVDPAPGGTGIEVAVTTGESEGDMAIAIKNAVDAHAAFSATVLVNVVTITDAATGARTDITAGNSGATVAVGTPGVTAVTAASLNNKYFTLHGTTGNAAYHVWCNVASGGTDPAPASSTGIEVTLAADDTDSEIATAIQTAVHASAAFNATVDTDTATITDAATGVRTDIGAGNAGLTVAVDTQGVTAVAATVPVFVITAAASSNFSFTLPATGVAFRTGVVVCNSSAYATKAAGSADCFFTAVVY